MLGSPIIRKPLVSRLGNLKSTEVRRISKPNKKNSATYLRHAIVGRIHFELYYLIILQSIQNINLNELLEFWIQNTKNIFRNESLGFYSINGTNKFAPHITFIINTLLLACYRKWLAWRTSMDYINITFVWAPVDFSYITRVRPTKHIPFRSIRSQCFFTNGD
ncbi:hypothetical protein BK663_19490 [Pseudomonas lini]|uniref:Uncharacterized protein n=1 Tax=Pseudomonas lini TaxID=163011 RepID=A0A423IJM7_9PSED|nr:hypothetical protein BK663_19490 [Pseudomonas lini]